jgi:HTH-type transcriptional regulator/antitoxin HigA
MSEGNMDIRPIRTEGDYDAALADVEQYFVNEPARGTPEGDRFEILLTLIGNYEQKRWAIEPPNDPVEAISLIMQDRGLDQKELGVLLGSRSRASELLRRIRPLSMEQAQTLYREWHVPAEVLLAPSIVKQTRRRRVAARKASSPIQKRAARKASSSMQKRAARKMLSPSQKRATKTPAQKRAARKAQHS